MALAVTALLIGTAAGGIATWWVVRDERPPQQASSSAPVGDDWPRRGTSRTVTSVRADGSVDVTHRIHTREPIDELDLSLPDALSSSTVEATAVEVVADGRRAPGPDSITFTQASYAFADATRILVRYRLVGAVERTSSASGRGRVTTTALTVSATPPDDVRVVRSASVLSLTCARSASADPSPCGEPDGEGQWTVRLTDADPGARVVASVTVPSS